MSTAIAAAKTAFAGDSAKRATRVWSQLTLEHLVPACPAIIGGSADLTGSNGTRTKYHTSVKRGRFEGNYIHYGVREHGMAAAMNGLALHGGIVPYGATFLVFTDYCRPSIRLSALMQQRVIYVMTHDSIGLGEDGPTHQPVEHLAALRAIPGLLVMRPADSIETAECWEIALRSADRPSILALTRQAVVHARADAGLTGAENLCAKGGYVLKEPAGGRDVTLIATGSEIGLALEAAETLGKDGIRAAVVSLPSFELFRVQDAAYREGVLASAPRIAIEAGVEQGWREWLRPTDTFIGMSSFGASAPGPKVYEHFGITAGRMVAAAKMAIGKN
jgi:transketolase